MNVLVLFAHPEPASFNGALRDVSMLHPPGVGLFNFCGFDTLEPFIAWAAGNGTADDRRSLLAAWERRLDGIEGETPQPFRHPDDFASPAMRDHREAHLR